MDRTQAIRAIRDAVDLPALVSETTKIRKQGGGWMGGPCPVHGGGSRTPCLSIQPERHEWHCFSCNAGGDAFDWMKATRGLEFEDALEELSRKTGIELPAREGHKTNPAEDRAFQALQSAQDFYASQIEGNVTARDYLLDRGIGSAVIDEEGIGFAPEGWDATIQHLLAQGFRPDILEAAGIAARSQRGTLIDLLRNRITLPIKDSRGRIIAFGGRAMPGAPDDTPKYINTRETPLFKKSEVVFHLNRARAFMREEGATLVEGYFDVFSLVQQGVQGAVAPLGTAITEQHLQTIKRLTNRINLVMDGDAPGQRAAARALALMLPLGFEVRMLQLPEGDDPDTWARKEGAGARAAIKAAPDWASFALENAKAGKDLRRIEDRLAAAREVASWIAYLPTARREEMTLAAAHELKVPPQSLQAPQATPAKQAPQAPKAPPRHEGKADEAVMALVSMAARKGPFLDWVRNIPRGWWEWRPGAGILEAMVDADGDTEGMDSEAQGAIRAAVAREHAGGQVDTRRLQMGLEREYIQRETQALMRRMAQQAGDEGVVTGLQQQVVELRARLARLTRGGGR